MELVEFLKIIALIFGLSAFVVYLLHRAKLPSVIGFLISGIIVGPYGVGLVGNVKIVEIFAEIGIILLLFVLGIELSPTRLFEMKRFIFLVGGVQILLTTLLIMSISLNFFNLNVAVFIGLTLSLSSMAVVLKHLVDRGELDTPHGKVIVGILIFQDLIAVLITAFIPFISRDDFKLNEFLFRIFTSILFVFFVIVAPRKFIPFLMFQIVKSRVRDLFIISVLLLCFSVALFMYELGFSLAFGAFLAGLLISESEYAHQVTSDIIPFRESFMAIFFVSLGMLFNVDFIYENLASILLLSILVMLIKVIGVFLSVIFAGGSIRVSLISAFSLAQISEFSFVLILLGKRHELISENFYNFFISSAVITIMLSPVLFVLAYT